MKKKFTNTKITYNVKTFTAIKEFATIPHYRRVSQTKKYRNFINLRILVEILKNFNYQLIMDF